MEEVVPAVSGRVVAVTAGQGSKGAKGEIIAFVEGEARDAEASGQKE